MRHVDPDAIASHASRRFRSEYDCALFEYYRSAKVFRFLDQAGVTVSGSVLDARCGGGMPLSFAGAHLPKLAIPVPLHLVLGRRAAFSIFVWLARHVPWVLQVPEHENSFIKLAREGPPKHDDLLEKVRIPRLREQIRQARLSVVTESLQVTGTFRRAPAAMVRWLRETPLVQDIVIGNVEYVLVRQREG